FLCREARQMAHHFQMHFGTRTAADLARIYGVETTSERIGNGPDRLISLADCSLRPPKINLNLEAIDALARYGQSVAGVNEKKWFAESQIIEVVTAQKLYCFFRQNSSSPPVEMAAHCFARTFSEIPFSSLFYNTLLQQTRDKE